MKGKRLPRSVRKYIRREKAEIRRQFLDPEERVQKIKELYNQFKKLEPKN